MHAAAAFMFVIGDDVMAPYCMGEDMQFPFMLMVVIEGIPAAAFSIPAEPKLGACGEHEFIADIGGIAFIEYVEVIADMAFADVDMPTSDEYNFCGSIMSGSAVHLKTPSRIANGNVTDGTTEIDDAFLT